MNAIRAAAAALAAALGLALALSGCGLTGGGAGGGDRPAAAAAATSTQDGGSPATTAPAHSGGPSTSAIARTRATHELPTPVPASASRVTGGWRTPTGAVRAFAGTYVNWTAATVAARLRALAGASVGQARSAMARAAGQVARDRELHRGGIANSGVVEAVAPVTGRRHAYAVVTRERTTAAHDGAYRGLSAAWHVSVATVTRLPDGLWVLSGWQPEN